MKVGDYVRTTYGIGKITNAFVVYTDDGYIWHLSYMTDNPKIEIGIFTKESCGLFGEVQKNHNIKYEPLNEETQKYFDMVYSQKLEKPICYVPVRNGFPRNASLYRDHKFIKSSPDIIDLIGEEDYVNGKLVEWVGYKLYQNQEDGSLKGVGEKIILFDSYIKDYIISSGIKSIITKEQLEYMEYKVVK